jgi:hypothetical protein
MKLTNSFSRYCDAISCELIGYFKKNSRYFVYTLGCCTLAGKDDGSGGMTICAVK